MSKHVNITIELPVSIFNLVETIALENKVESDEILQEALKSYIYEWKDYKIAKERLKDTSDDILKEEKFIDDLKKEYKWKI